MLKAVTKFEILLEHDIDEQYQYEPGETMKGKVVLCSEESINVKAILVQVKGEATVSWSNESKASPDVFSTSESYLDETFAVFGSDRDDSKSVEVARREDHTYPFEFTLPLGLPSSFIGKNGSVAYIIKAMLREGRGGPDASITTEPFLVLRPLDLSSNPELLQRRTVVASRRTSGPSVFCCLFGKTVGNFTVNKTGFLAGDCVIIDADVTNEASQPIKSIQAALVLVCTFKAKKMVRSHSQVITKKTDNDEVDYGGSRKWSGARLSVPSYIPESRLDGCDMIEIAYEMHFRMEMADGSDVTASIPITIGTPLRKTANTISRGSVRKSKNGSIGRRISGKLGEGNGELEMNMENDLEKFRHPMVPGETRKNILFEGNFDYDGQQ